MKVALIIFDQMTSLDFVGFYDPITRLKSMGVLEDFSWDICARKEVVTDDRGLRFVATKKAESLASYDLLFLPGGMGTRKLQLDSEFITWIQTASSVAIKTSVCTGSLILGAAGFLKHVNATTHFAAYNELKPYCKKVVEKRIVDDGNIITAGGVFCCT